MEEIAAMKPRRIVLLLSALACASAVFAAASAQSLREIRAREADNEAFSSEVAYTRLLCENGLTGEIDWSSAADWPSDQSLAAACDGALGALEAMCRSDAGKARAQRITHFVCAGDGDGASLRGETLRYGASPGSGGFDDVMALLEGAQ
jgi:hypothetical protein